MGAIFSRVKVWIDNEDVDFSDLNAEFDNILTNLVPLQLDDYSVNVAQMKLTADPGELATEILATTLAGEIERLRFIIAEITGKTQWYETPDTSLFELNQLSTSSGNLIVSGKSRSGSNQLVALDPDGTTAEVVLRAASTSFVFKIEGTQVTISSDVTLSSLQLASGDGTTDIALVDDSDVADGLETKILGENGTTIPVDNMGSEITVLIGKRATFRINNGSTDEFFTAFVESSSALTKVRRGYFFNTSDAPISRIAIANNDVITLMKATWIFATTTSTLKASFLSPIYDVTQPTAIADQYWFDLANDKWLRGNGSTFDDADATLIGETVQNSTGCVGARTHEINRNLLELSTPSIDFVSNSQIRTKLDSSKVSIFGTTSDIKHDFILWDMSTDLDSGVSEAASTPYHMYLKENGSPVISDVAPYDRRSDLLGFYHPHQTWRAIASIDNNGSSNFDSSTLARVSDQVPDESISTARLPDGVITKVKLQDIVVATSGANPGEGGFSISTEINFSSTSVTPVDVTNSSVTITTSGRPVMLSLQSSNTTFTGTPGHIAAVASATGSAFADFAFLRGSTVLSVSAITVTGDTSSVNNSIRIPAATFSFIDDVAAGTHTYKMQTQTIANNTASLTGVKLVAREL